MIKKIIDKNFTPSQRVLLILFFIMAIGVVTFLASPFILIWSSWEIAWRVGFTGLLTSILPFAGWWVIYNVACATKKNIENEQERN